MDEDVAGDISDDEAAWRDLIAHYGDPAAAGDAPLPWPSQEDLPGRPAPAQAPTGSRPKPSGPLQASRAASPQAPGKPTGEPEGSPGAPAGEADAPATDGATDPSDSTSNESSSPDNSSNSDNSNSNDPDNRNSDNSNPVPGVFPTMPQFRVIRPAAPVPPGDEMDPDDEGHFIPPEPPPLPHLDTVSKFAWAAVFGGPAYLLVAVMVGWIIPGWAGLAAVAAFIGGFATLVVRMGDRPPTDSGPDDGAVI